MFRRAASLAIRSNPKLCNGRFSTAAGDDIAHLIRSNINSFRTSPAVDQIPSNDGPFPFDIATEDPATGTITLVRKTKDEIINIAVRDSPEQYYVDDQVEGYDDGEHEYKDGQVLGDEDDQAPTDQGCGNKKDIPCLYMDVKIYYGPKYGRRLKFFVMAFRDRIGVRTVVMRDAWSHLELFDKYFKDRGIE